MLLEGKPFMTEFVKEGYDCKKRIITNLQVKNEFWN